MQRYIKKAVINTLLKKSPTSAATISKLVEEEGVLETEGEKSFSHEALSTEYFSPPEDFASNYQASLDALKLFPDLKLAAAIYASLVVSPSDLASNMVIIGSKDNLLMPDIKGKLLRMIDDELEQGYDIVGTLDEVLLELLVGKGSVVRVTIPENSLDDFIHGRIPYSAQISQESAIEIANTSKAAPLGILGSGYINDVAAESDGGTRLRKPIFNQLEVIDNFNCLKLDKFRSATRSTDLRNHIYGKLNSGRVSVEAEEPKEEKDTSNALIRNNDLFRKIKPSGEKVIQLHKEEYATRDSLTRPLRFDIPSEAVIPVITPGKPDDAKGYFVMLDDKFNFLTLETRKCGKEQGIESQMRAGKEDAALRNKMAEMLGSTNKDKQAKVSEVAFSRFKEVIKQEMTDRLNTGLYSGSSFEVTENKDIEYLMFLRTLAAKQTKLLFLPAEMVAYYATAYTDQGIGKNVIEDLKELNNMRGALLFSDVMATVKNNLRTTNVNLSLDPTDPHPAKTIKIATAEVMKTRAMDLPINMSSLSQLSEWVQRAGFTFSFDNHPQLPQVKFDFTDQTISRPTGENDTISEKIRDQQFNAFGLTPEVVDTGLDINFATTDQANRKFLLKRIRKTRNLLSRTLTAELQHIIKCDPNIYKPIYKVLEECKLKDADDRVLTADDLFVRFINSVKVTLPNLEEDNSIKLQAEKYEEYRRALEVALEAWLHEDMYDRAVFGDELPDMLQTLHNQIKGHFLRDYQTKSGYFSELGDLTTLDSAGDSFLKMGDLIPEHVIGILTTAKDFYKGVKTENKKMRKLIEEINQYIEGEDEEDTTDTDTDDQTTDDQTNDDQTNDEETTDKEGGDEGEQTDDDATDDDADNDGTADDDSDETTAAKGTFGAAPKSIDDEPPTVDQPE